MFSIYVQQDELLAALISQLPSLAIGLVLIFLFTVINLGQVKIKKFVHVFFVDEQRRKKNNSFVSRKLKLLLNREKLFACLSFLFFSVHADD